MSQHKFDLNTQGIKRICKKGSRVLLNAEAFKAMKNMAIASLILKKDGIREPHWHPNADELAYCLEGKALITIFSPGNLSNSFTLEQGEVTYFPKGYIHHIENIHSKDSRFILCYNHENPEDLDLSESIGSMPSHILSLTFSEKKSFFEKLKKNAKDIFISQKKPHKKVSFIPIANNYFKFDIEKINPQINTKAGSARIVNKTNFPILDHLALFSLRISKNGVREPHWHPNATELNYVLKGKARLNILSPGGKLDTFELKEKQGSIIPAGYFHHIENRGSSELHMAVFFNNANPNDIGLSGVMSTYSNTVLGSLYSLNPSFFNQLNRFHNDRMIVGGG